LGDPFWRFGAGCHRSGQAEVGDEGPSGLFLDHDVQGRDVAVDHPFFMGGGQAGRDL
jgi:hypothetical protein